MVQWDHKNGDGKNDPRQGIEHLLRNIQKNPDRWMRLCRLHNRIKCDLSKGAFEVMILDMSDDIRAKLLSFAYTIANNYLRKNMHNEKIDTI